MMWEVLLYICRFYWLMNKVVLVKGRNLNRERKKEAESGRHHVSTEGDRHQNLTGRSQPRADT